MLMFVGATVRISHSKTTEHEEGVCKTIHFIHEDDTAGDFELENGNRYGFKVDAITDTSIEGDEGYVCGRRKIEVIAKATDPTIAQNALAKARAQAACLQAELKAFLPRRKSNYDVPWNLRPLLQRDEEAAFKQLKQAVANGTTYEELLKLSTELHIPIEKLHRSPSQVSTKNRNAGPFEIWQQSLYSNSKIGIGNTLQEAVDDAVQYFLTHR
jgi:hypothetical protein